MVNILNKVEDKVQLDNQINSIKAHYINKSKNPSSTIKKGKYLYCFMCQSPADYYCKDTKIPVCSVQCKKYHL